MCGILGVAGPGILQRDLDIFKDLGMVSQLRGLHGSGVFQIRSEPYRSGADFEEWSKSSSPWVDHVNVIEEENRLVRNKSYLLDTPSVDVIIGHVRHATKGKISDDNAHPFVFSKIVGVHNGTLKDVKYQHATKTDSELMFSDMNSRGVGPVLKELDKDSAYAIVVYDYTTSSLIFARNAKRPMHFAVLEDRNVMYWASESEMLKFILKRNGLKFTSFSLNEDWILKVKPSEISFKNREKMFKSIMKLGEEKKEEEKPVPRIIAPAQQKPNERKAEENLPAVDDITPWETDAKGVVLPFKPVKTNDISRFFMKCSCGQHNMNLIDSHFCRMGDPGYPAYDKETDTYACVETSNTHSIH